MIGCGQEIPGKKNTADESGRTESAQMWYCDCMIQRERSLQANASMMSKHFQFFRDSIHLVLLSSRFLLEFITGFLSDMQNKNLVLTYR